MADIACPQPPGNPTTIGGAFAEFTATNRVSGISGTSFITNSYTQTIDQDPSNRFEIVGPGELRVNRDGMVVIDWFFTITRSGAAVVDDLILELLVNATPCAAHARYQLIGAGYAAVPGALPSTPGFNIMDLSLASWVNAGDVLRPRAVVTGPGTIESYANNDAGIGNGLAGSLIKCVHLGVGVEPYAGSVWP